MESLAFLSPSGRTARASFALGVIVVYVLIFASQTLLSPSMMMRSGMGPFAVAHAALIYAWYVLHARRLHDAERGTGSALAIAILYGLGVVLLMLLVLFVGGGPDGSSDSSPFAGFLFIVFLIAFLTGDPSTIGLFFYVAMIILIVILLPFLIALGFSVWAGTRPPAPAPAPPSAGAGTSP